MNVRVKPDPATGKSKAIDEDLPGRQIMMQ